MRIVPDDLVEGDYYRIAFESVVDVDDGDQLQLDRIRGKFLRLHTLAGPPRRLVLVFGVRPKDGGPRAERWIPWLDVTKLELERD